MSLKIGINGFGRIGRLVFKRMFEKGGYDVVAINDLTDNKTLAHLLKYDSTQGRFPAEISHTDTSIIVNGKEIKGLSEKDPTKLPWEELGVDIVIESTGVFSSKEKLGMHITAGAKKSYSYSSP
jgi:glyceraldehyde 3-phosphate dehydrogenase